MPSTARLVRLATYVNLSTKTVRPTSARSAGYRYGALCPFVKLFRPHINIVLIMRNFASFEP